MRIPRVGRVLWRGALGVGLAAATACSPPPPETIDTDLAPASNEPVTLVVRNNGYFDVDVFAVRTTSGSVIREGTVSGSGTRRLTIPQSDLQTGQVLVIRLRAIGTIYTWESRPVSVSQGGAAELDIAMDAYGAMYRSVLVPLPDPPPTPDDHVRDRPAP